MERLDKPSKRSEIKNIFMTRLQRLQKLRQDKQINAVANCPFCDGSKITPNGNLNDFYYQCQECTTTGPSGDSLESARLQWNKRENEDLAIGISFKCLSVIRGYAESGEPRSKALLMWLNIDEDERAY